jgi:hypothetical protein
MREWTFRDLGTPVKLGSDTHEQRACESLAKNARCLASYDKRLPRPKLAPALTRFARRFLQQGRDDGSGLRQFPNKPSRTAHDPCRTG